jgi:hypothetical protein
MDSKGELWLILYFGTILICDSPILEALYAVFEYSIPVHQRLERELDLADVIVGQACMDRTTMTRGYPMSMRDRRPDLYGTWKTYARGVRLDLYKHHRVLTVNSSLEDARLTWSTRNRRYDIFFHTRPAPTGRIITPCANGRRYPNFYRWMQALKELLNKLEE